MIDPLILKNAEKHSEAFNTSLPFKHLILDSFLSEETAEKLLKDFPSFQPQNAMSESGHVGRKACVSKIQTLGAFYQTVYDRILSQDFLQAVSLLTGIPDLIADPTLMGAGTHENLGGQALDPHVDFNYLEPQMLHRRLNLLLYLNKEWKEEWGGSLELHSNPRQPAHNEIKTILPLFNRCVIFETSEYSWHGFPKIILPEDKQHLSRKSFSLYLYTASRPASETAAPHTTFYIPRPKPPHLKAGHVLNEEDAAELDVFFAQRDQWIEFYQKRELEFGRQLANARETLKAAEKSSS